MAIEFRMLGPVEVSVDGRVLPLGSLKQRTLLGLLLVHANEAVSRDRLIEELWAEGTPATVESAIHVYLSRLRKLLETAGAGDVFVREAHGYRLRIEPEQLDVNNFERLASEGSEELAAGQADVAAALLREALGLWRGAALADLQSEHFAVTAAARLEERRLLAVEQRVDADLALGRGRELIGELERLVTEHPYRERLHAQLMLALYRSGRQIEALELYRQVRLTLVGELGIEPGPLLQRMERAILSHDAGLERAVEVRIGEAAFPAPTSLSTAHLPRQPTPFVGRERELAEVLAMLRREQRPILTLTGAGGSGKTRLALQAAADAASDYPDGVFWVPLQALRDPGLVTPTLAQAVGAKDDIVVHLGHKRALVLMDNFEQVISAASDLADLSAQLPNLKLLVTSREPLHLAAEREYSVPPLRESEAVALFCERARAIKADFVEGDAALEICRRLDCLPLAIELAASRVKIVTPRQIVERLDAGLDVLATPAHDVPPRQRTLKATLDWSYALLSDEEKRAFAELAVLVGGFTIEAAEAVADAGLDVLTSLVDKSLVVRVEQRFEMLDVINQYAATKLVASPQYDRVRLRQAEYILAFAKSDRSSQQWPLKMRDEHGNVLAALDYYRALGLHDLELELAVAASDYWRVAGHHALGRARLEAALNRAPQAAPALRAKGLSAAGSHAHDLGDYAAVEQLARRRLVVDPTEEQSFGPSNTLGIAAQERGDHDEAHALFATALEKARRANSKTGVAIAVTNLGALALWRGDHNEAKRCFRESLNLAHELGNLEGIAIVLSDLALVALAEGDNETALQRWHEAFDASTSIGFSGGIIWSALGVAALAVKKDAESATRLLGAADALLTETGRVLEQVERRLRTEVTENAQQRLTSDSFLAAFEEGRRAGAVKLLKQTFHS